MKLFQRYINQLQKEITSITSHNLKNMSPTTIVIDVREKEEYEKERIPGSIFTGRSYLEMSMDAISPESHTPVTIN